MIPKHHKISPKKTEMQIDRLSFRKIFFHVDKIHEYLTTGDAYPIHMIIGFTDYCNHNCLWCYTAYTTHNDLALEENGRYQHVKKARDDRMIDSNILLDFLRQAREKGLKAVSIVGSGEPLLHPQSAAMLEAIGKMGIDFGVFTNGQVVKDSHLDVITRYASFIRFSLDAADAETYKRLHGPSADFEQTLENIQRIIQTRNKLDKTLPTVGAQFVTSHLNADSMEPFTQLMRDIGVDYVAFKPMYDNPVNIDHLKNTFPLEEALHRLAEIKRYETNNFMVYDKEGEQFRNAWGPQRFNGAVYYTKCMSHQFSPPLYANGDIYLCLNLGGRKEFVIGNVYENTIEEIWNSERRKKAIAAIDLLNKCPARCKLDPLNKIMWDITNPNPEIHPNFI